MKIFPLLLITVFFFGTQSHAQAPNIATVKAQLSKLLAIKVQQCEKAVLDFEQLGDKVPTGKKTNKGNYINKEAFALIFSQLNQQNSDQQLKTQNLINAIRTGEKKEIDSIAENIALYESNCKRVIRLVTEKVNTQKTSKWQIWK